LTRKDGHHPIIFMQCGPVRHHVDARAQAATRPFEHLVTRLIVTMDASLLGGASRPSMF
jgi:superfamily II DNA or RNA helicase